MTMDIAWKYFQWLTELIWEKQINQDVHDEMWNIGWDERLCGDLDYERWYLRAKIEKAKIWDFDFDFVSAQMRVDQLFDEIHAVTKGAQYCRLRWEYTQMAIEECLTQLDKTDVSQWLMLWCQASDTIPCIKSNKYNLTEKLLKIRGPQPC